MTKKWTTRWHRVTKVMPFKGVANVKEPNPNAWGGFCVIEERNSDGALRWVNFRGHEEEVGPWIPFRDPRYRNILQVVLENLP